MSNLRFYPGQPEEEVTQFVVFKSVFALLPFIFAALIIALASLYGIYFGSSGQTIEYVPIDSSVYMLISTVIFFANFAILIAAIWVWRHNRMVVTNLHLVDIDQHGLFSNKIATLSLGVIQDVSSTVSGPMQTLFDYGTLIVQTAGERENFSFDYLPNPHKVEQQILDIHKKYTSKKHHRHDGLVEHGSAATAEVDSTTADNEPQNPLL